MTTFQIHFLGASQIKEAGQAMPGIRSQKAIALLGYLAIEARPVARASLAALFWGGDPAEKARRELRRVLHNLTSLIPGCLYADRRTVEYSVTPDVWVDVHKFANLADAGDIEQLIQAGNLYQGELMEGLYLDDCPEFETWLLGERERFRQMMVRVLDALVAHYQTAGDFAEALVYALRLLVLNRWHEEAHRQVMLLLARTGQFSAALRQYHVCSRVLFDELGVEPAPETTLLFERLQTAVSTARHNLPPPATAFVGREQDLVDISHRLLQPDCRLMTIAGLGGMGKTRLALEVTRQLSTPDNIRFLNGVWLVPLLRIADQELDSQAMADQIALAISTALGLNFVGARTPADQLIGYLQDKELLLLLDNYEHLLPHTAVVSRILQETTAVKLLITSRERLNLRQEQIVHVDGLAVPSNIAPMPSMSELQQVDSVQLFTSVARRVQPSFSFAEEGEQVVEICRRLFGMPLALELTAVWVRTLSCKEVLAEIKQGIDNLSGQQRNLPQRHGSMQAVFNSSWHKLSQKEQQVLQKCTIFRDGFVYDAAINVAGADRVNVAALVDKSLIRRTKTGRYEIHELLRQFAALKLDGTSGELANLQGVHGRYYINFLCRYEDPMMERKQANILAEIDADLPNILKAWAWAITTQAVNELNRLIWPFAIYFELRNRYKEAYQLFHTAHQEVTAWFEQEVKEPALLARLALWRIYFLMRLGHIDQALMALEALLPTIRQHGTQQDIGWALIALGEAYWICGAYHRKRVEPCFAEALTIFENGSPIWLVGYAQARLAQGLKWKLGQPNAQIQHLLRSAHDIAVELENDWLNFYVEIISSQLWREPEQANLRLRHLDAALAAAKRIGFKWGAGSVLISKSRVAMTQANRLLSRQTDNMDQYVTDLLHLGDALPKEIDGAVRETAVAISHAIQHYENARNIFEMIDDRLHADHAYIKLGKFCRHVGLNQRAIRYYERAIVTIEKNYEASSHAQCLVGLAEIYLADEAFDTALRYFSQARAVFDAIGGREWDIAWINNGMGDVAYAQGAYEQAQLYFEKCLPIFIGLSDDEGTAVVGQNLADTLHKLGNNDQATQLYERSLPLCHKLHDEVGLGVYFFGMVKTRRDQQTATWAATLLGVAATLLHANTGEPLPPTVIREFDAFVAAIRASMDDDDFDAAWANGQSLLMETAVALAQS
ncbi:MAG: tetratricopeptide repeat protein [Chloroflexi bacterium]|nr:tetratricopeptide repeat protein [Chloroflexota bacterium]